ncbi:alpha/beta hydrolase [Micromonospora sp. NPDC005215]|uniref:alpha/beta fold hydrolase n=1 Tax=Micromonospora sp. NPDC005215 TaxID=3157024 RepID=UPI0033A7C45A
MSDAEFDAFRRTVRTGSGEISYLDAGSGRPALFVHGLGTNAHIWRNVIDQLRGERRCIALDLPLHGRSPALAGKMTLPALAEAVEDFCSALDLTEIDLVTNDTGGAVGQIFVARHGHRLRTLTLTNCEAHDNLPNEAFAGTVALAREGKLAPLAGRMLTDLAMSRSSGRGIGANFEHPDRLSDETLRDFLAPVAGSAESIRRFEELLASLDPADLLAAETELRKLKTPTLIVWGTADLHFELKWAYWLRDAIPGATDVVEIDGGKLFFPYERAGELVAALRRHWNGN